MRTHIIANEIEAPRSSVGVGYFFIVLLVGLMVHSYFSTTKAGTTDTASRATAPRLRVLPLDDCGIEHQLGAFTATTEHCKPLFTFTLAEVSTALMQAGLLAQGESLYPLKNESDLRCPYLIVAHLNAKESLCFTTDGGVYRSLQGDKFLGYLTANRQWAFEAQEIDAAR